MGIDLRVRFINSTMTINHLRLATLSMLLFSALFSAEQPNPRVMTEPWKSYFEKQVSALEGQLEREIKTKEDWLAKKDEYRRQLAEMLGLDPLPPRSDLKATKTGEFEQDGVIVENLHYQSMPGLYVTANLYRPKNADKPLPAILCGCGHANMMKNGISYGNKAGYEHHGMWYAKHGFVCLVYDTVQLGEIRGEHHGTYDKGRWWWFSRGYTPAGVEAWAGIRGLDYLETRPEVDKTRFGMTGRSGGGAYSWWIAALDERIKVAAPTAGITTLRNHVIDGCVAGHCDCMFMVNTYRWDYDKLAALVAPRALLIANTDKDDIFPIDGVFKIYQSTRRIYKLLGAEKNIGMQFAEGPHMDTQPLNVGEFHWMTRMLQGAEIMSTLDAPAVKSIPMEKLRVFNQLPSDQRNTTIDESFVPFAKTPETPANSEVWKASRDAWMKALRMSSFSSPFSAASVTELDSMAAIYQAPSKLIGELMLSYCKIKSTHTEETEHDLFALVAHNKDVPLSKIDDIRLYISDTMLGTDILSGEDTTILIGIAKNIRASKSAHVDFCPRGTGAMSLPENVKVRTQLLRRFYLIGETLESAQVFDIRCTIRALSKLTHAKITIQAKGDQAVNALYASLFEDNIAGLELSDMPKSHMQGPAYLSVLKFMDIPQAVAMAAERTHVVIHDKDASAWSYAVKTSDALGWSNDPTRGIEVKP